MNILDVTGAVVDTVENAVMHPIAAIEGAAGAVVAGVEAAGAAVVVEVEDLAAKVRKFFDTTSSGHLQDALLAIVDRLTALEDRTATLEASMAKVSDFVGK